MILSSDIKIMKMKKYILYMSLFLGALMIVNLYAAMMMDLRVAVGRIEVNQMYVLHSLAMILCFLLGILLEFRRTVLILTKKCPVKLSPVLLVGMLLFMIALLPPIFYIQEVGVLYQPFPKGGLGVNLFFGALNQSSHVHSILSVVSGSLFIKGLSQT